MTTEERIAQLEARVAVLESNAPKPMPEECRDRECTYYTHYLAQGAADLTHDGFHAAEAKASAAQKRVFEWYDAHPSGQLPPHLEMIADRWEKAVRA